MKKTILPALLATVWISISEFVRNELLLKSFWVEHYKKLGLVFPSAPINGIVFGLWSFLFGFLFLLLLKGLHLKKQHYFPSLLVLF